MEKRFHNPGARFASRIDPETGVLRWRADQFAVEDLDSLRVAAVCPRTGEIEITIDGSNGAAQRGGESLDLFGQRRHAGDLPVAEHGVQLVLRVGAIEFDQVDRPRSFRHFFVHVGKRPAAGRVIWRGSSGKAGYGQRQCAQEPCRLRQHSNATTKQRLH
jgi:hypothetical protein